MLFIKDKLVMISAQDGDARPKRNTFIKVKD